MNVFSGERLLNKLSGLCEALQFIQGEKEDQEIVEACRRVLELPLSLTCTCRGEEWGARATLIKAIRNGSVATWAHFNLHGEFVFSDKRIVDSMGLRPPKKSGSGTGLKLGDQKFSENLAGGGFMQNPMEL